MTLEEQCRLSFYKEIAGLGNHENVKLVQHIETQRIYVKKIQSVYNKEIYELLRKLHSRHVPEIIECVEENDRLILIEEYIQGESLAEHIQYHGLYDEEEAAKIFVTLCDILNLFHHFQPPIIHRDLKPENVIMTDDGVLKLVDFNTAKRVIAGKSQDTVLIGTREYAAPEQYGFAQSDARTDIYSMGVMLNYLLTGHYPKEKLYQAEEQSTGRSISAASGRLFTEIIRKCTEFSPDMRYQTVLEVKKDIASVMQRKHSLEGQCAEYPVKQKDSGEDISDSEEKLKTAGKESITLREWLKHGLEKLKIKEKTPKAHLWYHEILPPGFRTGTVWKMITAGIGYALIFWMGLTIEYTTGEAHIPLTGFNLWCERIGVLIWVLFVLMLMSNYRPIVRRLPLMNYRWIRIGMGVFYGFAAMIVVVLAALLLEMV